MAIIDDIKEKLQASGSAVWQKIQDSSAYHQSRDKFENLTPIQQKATLAAAAGLVVVGIFSVPWSYYSSSALSIEEFENRRDIIRELLKVTKEASETSPIPIAPAPDQIKIQVDGYIKSANLLPEQIKGINIQEPSSRLIPRNLALGSVNVQLSKLNLRQIIALGSQFQSISPSVKMQDLKLEANREDHRYFDMMVNLISLKVPEIPKPELELPPAKKSRSFRDKQNEKKDEE